MCANLCAVYLFFLPTAAMVNLVFNAIARLGSYTVKLTCCKQKKMRVLVCSLIFETHLSSEFRREPAPCALIFLAFIIFKSLNYLYLDKPLF